MPKHTSVHGECSRTPTAHSGHDDPSPCCDISKRATAGGQLASARTNRQNGYEPPKRDQLNCGNESRLAPKYATWQMCRDPAAVHNPSKLAKPFRPERERTLRKAYSTPRLTVHGSVERITLAKRKGRRHNNNHRNDNAADPGHDCNQGQGSFCS
jgi:hypothetical protein